MSLDQRISFLTIGVHNLERMKQFYCHHFGWTPLKDSDGIVFFKLNGFILSFYPHQELGEDAGMPPFENGFKGVTLSYNMRSEMEVDEIFASLSGEGVQIVKSPEKVFWGGYRGYFKDVEENLWEVAYNPFLKMGENGDVLFHQ